jgi:hypothetical protein
VDNDPLPIDAIDLQGAKVLVQHEQAKSTKGKKCDHRWRKAQELW